MGTFTTPDVASIPISEKINLMRCSNKSPFNFRAKLDFPPSIPSSAAPIHC